MKIKRRFNKKIFYFWVVLIGLVLSINILDKKRVELEVFKEVFNNDKTYVYPMGRVVGIKADTDGALVLGYEENDIEYIGGIKKGDNIVKINNITVKNADDIEKVINDLKLDEVKVTFERDGKYKSENIKTKKENGKYRLGLWARDKISGIGTITFYDPSEEKFSGIGHAITDVDTNKLLKIKQGKIYEPVSIEIIKGTASKTGQIKGNFNNQKPIGEFSNNTPFGISGELTLKKDQEMQLIEVGDPKDVKIGDAIIIFEDENKNLKTYDIKIESIVDSEKSDRDMVISVVDDELISYTGGVVRGMSGVPIIQNNKIIGAITHVFRDNPKKGYGIFINEMLKLDK